MYQVPALDKPGYEAATFDNRGMPPSDVPPGGYSLADLAAETEGPIEGPRAGWSEPRWARSSPPNSP